MKGNNGIGNNEDRDLWETPNKLYNELYLQYKFKIDCCANKNNTKCDIFFTDFHNILEVKEICWMNPPFSKAELMFKKFFTIVKKGVAIYRCDNMETKIWQEIILKQADWIFIPKGRINYESLNGNGSRFPSALIGIGLEPPKELIGRVLFTKDTIKENNK